MAGPTSPVPGGRPAWWPTETDLAAMVGLARCDGRGRPGEPCADEAVGGSGEPDLAEGGRSPGPTALAARLAGLLRTGC